jgi:hypothetical protein
MQVPGVGFRSPSIEGPRADDAAGVRGGRTRLLFTACGFALGALAAIGGLLLLGPPVPSINRLSSRRPSRRSRSVASVGRSDGSQVPGSGCKRRRSFSSVIVAVIVAAQAGWCSRTSSSVWPTGSAGRSATHRSARWPASRPGGSASGRRGRSRRRRAPADLAIEALQRIGRADLAPVVGREGVGGEDVVLGGLEHPGDLGQRAPSVASASESLSRAPARFSALKIGRISAASSPCWSLRACPRQSLRKCTMQRCHGAPSTLAIAFFRPSWASSCMPTRPRATSERTQSVQNASVSVAPTSRPMILGGRSGARRGR